jgi:formylglycine-generating enzyme required for sulfatase activity
LVQLVAGGKLASRERAAAGNTLARLGDPRFNTASWYLPEAPLFGFVAIPPGKFRMGSDPQQDTDAYEEEQPPHEVTLPAYWMARWPVTVAQFRAFNAARGQEGYAEAALMALDNHPVTEVSWHDAQAYCRWLDEQLKAFAQGRLASEPQAEMSRAFWAGLVSGALGVGLPSEAEWERAAPTGASTRGAAKPIPSGPTTLIPV